MPGTIDPTPFLLDGTLSDPMPAELWVSDDAAKLERALAEETSRLLDDSAPAELRGLDVRLADP